MTRPYKFSEEGRRKRSAAASEAMKRRHANPEFAAKVAAAASDTMKRQRANPEFEAKRVAASATPRQTLAQVHTLLDEGRLTIAEICQVAHMSAPTIYKYFPKLKGTRPRTGRPKHATIAP